MAKKTICAKCANCTFDAYGDPKFSMYFRCKAILQKRELDVVTGKQTGGDPQMCSMVNTGNCEYYEAGKPEVWDGN